MTHDPATLAAVRERIASLRVGRPSGVWDHAWNAALDTLETSLGVSVPTSPDTRAAPALTADDVRRIAREEAAKAMADRPEPNSPTMTPNSTQPNTWPAAVEPPAQPAAAKRVEAFLNVYEGNAVPDHWRAWPTRDQAESGRSATRHHVRVAYVREWPGVHDAASADAFDRAVLGAYRSLIYGGQGSRDEAVAALAPFLPVSR